MLNAIRTDSSGVKEGKLILSFLGDDQKRYDVALTAQAVSDALSAILELAALLPHENKLHGEGRILQGGVVFGVGPQMQPLLVISIGGGVKIPIGLSETQLASLHDDISKLLDKTRH